MLNNMPIISTLCSMRRLHHNAKNYANIMYLTLAWITYSASLQTRRISGRRFSPPKIRLRSQARITPIRIAQKANPSYFFLPSDPPQLSTLVTQARRKLNVKTKFFPRLISKLLTLMSVAFERRLKVNNAFTSVPLFWFVREHRVCSRFRTFPSLGSDRYTLTPTLNTHRYWI